MGNSELKIPELANHEDFMASYKKILYESDYLKNRVKELYEQIDHQDQKIQKLEKQAQIDFPSGLYNSSFFERNIKHELERSNRYRLFFSVLLFHLEFRDAASTQKVHEEIKNLGKTCEQSSRNTDTISRFQSRQIGLVLPETELEGAHVMAERVLKMFPPNGYKISYRALAYPTSASDVNSLDDSLKKYSEEMYRQGY